MFVWITSRRFWITYTKVHTYPCSYYLILTTRSCSHLSLGVLSSFLDDIKTLLASSLGDFELQDR